MHTLTSFLEARKAKAAAQQQRDAEGAALRRDIFGPAYSGSQRRKDVKALNKVKPAPLLDQQGQPLPPVTAEEIGDGFRSGQRKKALPKYNASRPLGSR